MSAEKKWFSLRVISGKERSVRDRVDAEIRSCSWEDIVSQIVVPSEKVYKIRNGKKVIMERNILPGYILVEADHGRLKGDIAQHIANLPNVIHFLGKTDPEPMTLAEANRLLGKVDETMATGETLIEPFIVGETIKIVDGPFNDFVGDVQAIDEAKRKLKVTVKIFGRPTEVDLTFMQVEKQQ